MLGGIALRMVNHRNNGNTTLVPGCSFLTTDLVPDTILKCLVALAIGASARGLGNAAD